MDAPSGTSSAAFRPGDKVRVQWMGESMREVLAGDTE